MSSLRARLALVPTAGRHCDLSPSSGLISPSAPPRARKTALVGWSVTVTPARNAPAGAAGLVSCRKRRRDLGGHSADQGSSRRDIARHSDHRNDRRRRKVTHERLGDEVIHQYVPLDLKPAVGRFLDYWEPDLCDHRRIGDLADDHRGAWSPAHSRRSSSMAACRIALLLAGAGILRSPMRCSKTWRWSSPSPISMPSAFVLSVRCQ